MIAIADLVTHASTGRLRLNAATNTPKKLIKNSLNAIHANSSKEVHVFRKIRLTNAFLIDVAIVKCKLNRL